VLTIGLMLGLAVVVVGLVLYRSPPPQLTNDAIATALGRLVRDGAVTVEAGFVSTTGASSRGERDSAEARTLAVVRANGTIRVERLFTVMREHRG
jgi:hypothetical protein